MTCPKCQSASVFDAMGEAPRDPDDAGGVGPPVSLDYWIIA